tara:strand:- start:275 stop:568 length:294 start_codon:yes stop_codon:yes gene_type:complete
VKFKVDSSEVTKMFNQLDKMSIEVMKQSYTVYKNNTPIRSGNAKNRTKLENKLTIGGRYPYAGRLDEGWSKQSPQGMTEPTLKALDGFIKNYIKRVT